MNNLWIKFGTFGLDLAVRTTDSLVEVRLWDLEVSTVSERLDGEDEGLSGEHGQLTHHLPRVGDKQADVLLLADHPLVDMEATREDKVQTHVLGEWKEEEEKRREENTEEILLSRRRKNLNVSILLMWLDDTNMLSWRKTSAHSSVPDLPVWRGRPQLSPDEESLYHLTRKVPAFRGNKRTWEEKLRWVMKSQKQCGQKNI